jgi:hypothetical protein
MKKKSGRRGCDGNEYIVVTTPGERGTYSCDGCVNCCPTRLEQVAHDVHQDVPVDMAVEGLSVEEIQQASRCIKFVRDMVDHGLRADLTPTRRGKVLCTVMEAQAEADHWYQEYLKHSNDHMRSRAAGALSGEYGKLISEIRAVVVKGIKHRAAMGDGVDAVMPTSNEFAHNIYPRLTNVEEVQRAIESDSIKDPKFADGIDASKVFGPPTVCVCGNDAAHGAGRCAACEEWVCTTCGQAHNESKHRGFSL